MNAREPLRQQVGDLFVWGVARLFKFLQQLFHLSQMQQHVVFEGPCQHFGQRLATQVNSRGLAQCFQVVQKGDDDVDHALAVGLGDVFRNRQSFQDFFDAGVKASVAQAVGAFEHPAQGLSDVIGHRQDLRGVLLGRNRVGQALENRQSVADQAQKNHLAVVGGAISGLGGFGSDRVGCFGCGGRGCRSLRGRTAGHSGTFCGCGGFRGRGGGRRGGRCHLSGRRHGQGLALADHFECAFQLLQQGHRFFAVGAFGHGFFAQHLDGIERSQQQIDRVFVERGCAFTHHAQQVLAAVGNGFECTQLHHTAEAFERVKRPEQT